MRTARSIGLNGIGENIEATNAAASRQLTRAGTDKQPRRLLLTFLALCPFAFAFATYLAMSLGSARGDFFTFWLAGRMSWVNQNPYSAGQWVTAYGQYGETWVPNPVFLYPLPLAILLAPLGLIPLNQAYLVWTVISQTSVVLSLFLLLRSRPIAGSSALVFPLLIGAFLFRPFIVTLLNGQLGALLLLELALTAYLWERKRWVLGGAVLALASLKPTLGLPVIGLSALWLFGSRRWSAIGSMATSALLILSIGWIWDLSWISEFLRSGGRKLAETLGYSPTIWGLSNTICTDGRACLFGVGGFIGIVVVAGVAWVLFGKRPNLRPSLVLSIAVSAALLVTPYVWVYDQVLLLLPIAVVSIELVERKCAYVVAASIMLLVDILALLLLQVATRVGADVWGGALPGVVLCMVLILAFRTARDERKGWFPASQP